MKDEGLISNFHISVAKFYGPCNQKLDRQIRALYFQKSFNAFLVVADADGKAQNPIKQKIVTHFSDPANVQFEVIIFEHEIEDWICDSMGICVKGNKAAATLSKHENYEKYRLPHYVKDLDLKELCANCKTFQMFLSFLQKVGEINSNQ